MKQKKSRPSKKPNTIKKPTISKKTKTIRNILSTVNIFLAVLIILTGYKLITTELGKTTLALGYSLLTICTVLKVAQRW